MITVVLGMASPRAREDASLALLNYGFSFYETRRVYAAGRELARPRVYGARTARQPSACAANSPSRYRGRFGEVQTRIVMKSGLEAPVAATQSVGSVQSLLDGKVIAERALYPLAPGSEGQHLPPHVGHRRGLVRLRRHPPCPRRSRPAT